MTIFEDFGKEWFIWSWDPPDRGSIPKNGFVRGQPLGIVVPITHRGSDPPVCTLTWRNEDKEECIIENLPFKNGKLHAAHFPVSFGGNTIMAEVTLCIDERGALTGHLIDRLAVNPPGEGEIDGNTGTFIAEPHQPPLPTWPPK